MLIASLLVLTHHLLAELPRAQAGDLPAQTSISIRGVYGGTPQHIFERGRSLADFGLNAVWIGSGGISAQEVDRLHALGARVFAEFNTMHESGFLIDHPDASPVGPDGKVCPAPDGWQGVCPTHLEYRQNRMAAFRKTLSDFAIDGIWLDYHHSHASWEQAKPNLPDTCFCTRCLAQFQKETGVRLPRLPTSELSKQLLGTHRDAWVRWRCGVFTDWVREFKSILNETRPKALLGTFHCPWSATDFDNAIRTKLAIDLKAQAKYIDVFSIMPYHARFGHANDPAWISRQTASLGKLLGVEGKPGERIKIWPIVQLADWGEVVPLDQIKTVLEHGTRAPSTGVTVFHWSGISTHWDRVEAMGEFYRGLPGPRKAK